MEVLFMSSLSIKTSEGSFPESWTPDTSERTRFQILRYQNRVDQRYSQLTWHVQRTWAGY